MDSALVSLTLIAALGCGLNAGVFLSFSSVVMKALARLPAAQGIAAMQSINVVAVTPVFMTVFFGTAVACTALGAWALADWHSSYGPYLVTGSALYLAGPIGLTMAYHVPRNDALATVEPTDRDAEGQWRRYLTDWTRWNHVRAAAAFAAAAVLTGALHVD